MSARVRLTITFTLLFGAIVVALATWFYLAEKQSAYQRLDATLQVVTGAVAMSAQHEFSEHAAQAGGEADMRLVLYGADAPLRDTGILLKTGSRVVAYKPAEHSRFDLRQAVPESLAGNADLQGYRVAGGSFRIPRFNAAYQVFAARSLAPLQMHLARVRLGLFVLVPLGLALAALAGHSLAKRSLRPLNEFAATIDSITSSDLTARVTLRNHSDEIGQLGHHFNSLLDRLEQAFAVQRQFMADASHQIRTPVTVALTAAQVIRRDGNFDISECKETLRIIENQLLQLRRIVEDMFFLSQADTTALHIRREEIYFDDSVSQAVLAAQTLARAKDQKIDMSPLPQAKCNGDEHLLRQAILILLDNATKFAPEGGHIHVALFERGHSWVCSVEDDGPGILPDVQSHVFERFFRADTSAARKQPGAGLGLAIAKSILNHHNGDVRLVEAKPGRTIFEIELPAYGEEHVARHAQANSLAVRI